jgi:predicted DNA-binding transcriptional regulator YafY
MRADRLLSIILLLQSHRRLSGRELARRLEVSVRTIHRDMDALSAAGVPVSADRGARGGWTLDPAWKTDLTGLDARELDAIFLAPPPRLLASLHLGPAAERAVSKLLLALPSEQRSRARAMRQRLHIDLDGWYASPEELPVLPIVQQALWRERQLEIVYRTPGRGTSTRTIDPLGLVIKGTTWYLVAQFNGEHRTFRVSRVEAARVLDTPAARPASFDLAEYWSQSAQAFRDGLPQYKATLRVNPDAACWMRGSPMWNVERAEAPDADGWVVMDVSFGHLREACFLALGLGSHGEVLSPPALREAVLEQARSLIDRYRGREAPQEPLRRPRTDARSARSASTGISR